MEEKENRETEPQLQQLKEAVEGRNKQFRLFLAKLYLEGIKASE